MIAANSTSFFIVTSISSGCRRTHEGIPTPCTRQSARRTGTLPLSIRIGRVVPQWVRGAAAAMAVFREQGWGAEALTARATLRVEVTLPTVVHEVPVTAVERWMRSPSQSPREALAKNHGRG